MDNAVILALIALVPLAMLAGTLGSVVLWRGMAYYGDAMAHAAMLGVALSFALQVVPITGGILLITLALTLLLGANTMRSGQNVNSLLAVMAFGALSFGMVWMSISGAGAVDIHHYLLGDVLSLPPHLARLTALISIPCALLIFWLHRALVMTALDIDLARLAGVRVTRMWRALALMLALYMALAVPLIGVLLVTGMLVIPASGARMLSASPKAMMVVAAILAVLGVLCGIAFSLKFDSPLAPSIIAAMTGLWLASWLLSRLK